MIPNNRIGVLGCGWLGLPLAKSLIKNNYTVYGTTTNKSKIELLSAENTAFIKNNKVVAAKLSSSNASRWISNGGPLKSKLTNVELKNIEVHQCNSVVAVAVGWWRWRIGW